MSRAVKQKHQLLVRHLNTEVICAFNVSIKHKELSQVSILRNEPWLDIRH